jgi:hypothetical protein
VVPRPGKEMCGKSRLNRDSIHGQSNPKGIAIPTELSRRVSNDKPTGRTVFGSFTVDVAYLDLYGRRQGSEDIKTNTH